MASVSISRQTVVILFAYGAAFGAAVGLTRFGGGAAFLWIANAVLLASLVASPASDWRRLAITCWIAGTIASGVWGLGWTLGPVIAAVNVAEPLIAATLLRRLNHGRNGLDSTRDVLVFMGVAGALAPMASGLAGAYVIGVSAGTPYGVDLVRWTIAHALGAVSFTPVFVIVASGEARRWLREAGARRTLELGGLLLLVTVTSLLVFVQNVLPLLFLPVLPLMIVTFRTGRIGSASAVVIMAIVGTTLTLLGHGPVNLIHGGVGERLQFLQFYLAVTAVTGLPVAADLSRRAQLFERLRDSEARFRLLAENSTDVVLNLDPDGTVRYVSPSIALLGPLDPVNLLGQPSAALIASEDRNRVRAVHLRALANPGETFTVEFRSALAEGENRWFESHSRAVLDDEGVVQGVVSAVRETSDRRRQEMDLVAAAHTDPLTGLCNRRAFDRELAASTSADEPRGCVALFDLDHFKSVNDRYGHAAGDEVLKMFASRAKRQVRDGDMLARIGGEEFAILFPDIAIDVASKVCERIRAAVERAPFDTSAGSRTITVSIGLTRLAKRDTAEEVLRRTDDALYRSKAMGRNRLSLAA